MYLASRFNKKLDRFGSRYRNPLAEVADVLVTLWDQKSLIYSFPPLKLLSSFLLRIEMEGILMILITLD